LQGNSAQSQGSVGAQFGKGDFVKMMGIAEGEEDLVINDGKVMNVAGGTLYEVSISEGHVLVQVTKSYDDNYILFEGVHLDSPLVTKVRQAINQFVLWPTDYLQVPVDDV
jgi:hypothetical protein